ncbi:S-adenosyl-L-methionine-dependent methyltransferase [Xylariales sp. PMI_506]|nr:S-adenosyl-L-methionine-dependent methyltransferase [Xylariales sp. PMI_506]
MSQPASVYILNNGAQGLEESRLEYQHTQLFHAMPGKYFPDIITEHLKKVGPSPRVADVATGTAVWLRGVAKELPPTAQLDGYDFDVSKFPAAETLPSNVKLQYGNILEPFTPPEELYDVVHVRLLMYALKADQWVAAAQNLQSLLKPGGWVLWEETGYHSWFSFPQSPALSRYVDIDSRAAIKVGRDPRMPLLLLQHIQDAGYTDCEEKQYSSLTKPEIQPHMPRIMSAIATQSLNGLVEKGGMEGMRTKEDADKLAEEIFQELSEREANCGSIWVWGRKP